MRFTDNAENRRFSTVWPCKYRFDSDKIFRIILSQWELQADKKIKSTTHLLQLYTYYMFRHYQNDYETLACDCLLRNALQLLLLSNQRPKLLLLHVARGGVWFEIHDNNWGVQIHLDPQKLRSFKKFVFDYWDSTKLATLSKPLKWDVWASSSSSQFFQSTKFI